MNAPAIETRYDGCRFRSRLEARWARFFNELGIRWEYEPEGFVIVGRPYLPDFFLTDSGTWVEVKGSEDALDHNLMLAAAEHLPARGGTREGPRLLILGPIPTAPKEGDLGWIGLDPVVGSFNAEAADEVVIVGRWWGFGQYHKNLRPWVLVNTSTSTPVDGGGGEWLTPALDPTESDAAADAYRVAKSARFEYGESG